MWKQIKDDWLGILLYALFGLVLEANGLGVLENPLGFFAALGILMVVDIRSYSRGLGDNI